ncbi:unnamed protein product [Protopolystoma xenopodis]|uniref:Uncharacterized protein n=1 Tax=Protopolystoma xenopodis TaxID=117903 RepID=A0A3S5AJ29_9PLAT|nr:unnamed protein product [Protopolystoma xenopodis]
MLWPTVDNSSPLFIRRKKTAPSRPPLASQPAPHSSCSKSSPSLPVSSNSVSPSVPKGISEEIILPEIVTTCILVYSSCRDGDLAGRTKDLTLEPSTVVRIPPRLIFGLSTGCIVVARFLDCLEESWNQAC